MNLYGFAGGDPVNFSDPFGLMSCPPSCGEVFAALSRMAPAINQSVMTFAAMGVAGGVGAAGEIGTVLSAEALAIGGAIRANSPLPLAGASVYRVFGGKARMFGGFWSGVNPETIEGYASQAGLFTGNSRSTLAAGTLLHSFGVRTGIAAPGALGPGGMAEITITNPLSTVWVNRVVPFVQK